MNIRILIDNNWDWTLIWGWGREWNCWVGSCYWVWNTLNWRFFDWVTIEEDTKWSNQPVYQFMQRDWRFGKNFKKKIWIIWIEVKYRDICEVPLTKSDHFSLRNKHTKTKKWDKRKKNLIQLIRRLWEWNFRHWKGAVTKLRNTNVLSHVTMM